MESITVTKDKIIIEGTSLIGKVTGVITKSDDNISLVVRLPFGTATREIPKEKAEEIIDQMKAWLK